MGTVVKMRKETRLSGGHWLMKKLSSEVCFGSGVDWNLLTITIAVIRWQPVGRKKLVPWYRGSRPLPEGIKTQPLGRNELIALFINDWFGLEEESELIDRKKVSSHLQVLKSYFKADPFGKQKDIHGRKCLH